MASKIFWNRRSGFDRRLLEIAPNNDRRYIDRRSKVDNDYLVIIGDDGLDHFTVLVVIPIFTLLCFLAASSYFF